MAKKKTTYYQAVCYTTDHCDDDLIPEYVNLFNVIVNERKDVFHINSFTI